LLARVVIERELVLYLINNLKYRPRVRVRFTFILNIYLFLSYISSILSYILS